MSPFLVGVACMDTPMRNILNRLISTGEFEAIIFGDKVILDEDIENWPTCDFLISFFSTGFPLEKAIRYANLRKPFCINDLTMQKVLMDRRLVLKILDSINVPTPKRLISSHLSNRAPDTTKEIVDDVYQRTGTDISHETFINSIQDPFVEKPVSGEDHNIRIYYPTSEGGGMRRLFRKVGNKSSEFCPTVDAIRDDGSYIYEEFMFVDNAEDVKVYTIGEGFAHAETRKSPVVDGIVRRNSEGKEIRYITALSDEEKEISRKVCKAFGQTVCGFDLLRAYGKSYVIDVNGWSFVKGNDEYYDKCAQILKALFIDVAKKRRRSPISRSIESQWRLKAFLSVLRHGDRTPKQKAKFNFKSKPFMSLLKSGDEEVVLKNDQIQQVSIACNEAIQSQLEDANSLQSLRAILDLKAELPGTKIQVKPSYNKTDKSLEKVQLIVKWGGEFTHGGKHQSKDLGENLRKDLRIINKALLEDIKVYSSSERRVMATADIFVKAYLDIPQLPDGLITVSKEMLDDSNAAKEQMEAVKTKLQAILNPNEPIKLPEYYLPEDIDDPEAFLQEIIDLLSKIRGVMQSNLEEGDEILSIQDRWCCAESPYLFKERWEKIFKDFCDVDRSAFEPSKISELYDSLKYDLLHNREFCEAIFASPEFGRDLLKQLYGKAKTLFDFIAPQEYGIQPGEKLEIGMLNSMSLLRQIVEDLKKGRDSEAPCTRLYFTKESKVISLLNIVLLCGLPTKVRNHEIDELDYLTQITFELHERNSAEGQEYSLRIGFSPGAHDPNLIDQTLDGRHSLSVAPRRWISEHISLDEALGYLTPK
ncbi:histidine phosphatase superfamily-domain-containing protein [Chytridium lagenaria]|nr:histidine phosphatase superfamily-domain-containing protein [Chytridium lagenaria]